MWIPQSGIFLVEYIADHPNPAGVEHEGSGSAVLPPEVGPVVEGSLLYILP